MSIHVTNGQAFQDAWELLDVLDTFDAERRDAFDTIDYELCDRCESERGLNRVIEVIGPFGYHYEEATLCTDCYIEHEGSLR